MGCDWLVHSWMNRSKPNFGRL